MHGASLPFNIQENRMYKEFQGGDLRVPKILYARILYVLYLLLNKPKQLFGDCPWTGWVDFVYVFFGHSLLGRKHTHTQTKCPPKIPKQSPEHFVSFLFFLFFSFPREKQDSQHMLNQPRGVFS